MHFKATKLFTRLTAMSENEIIEKFGNSLNNLTPFDKLIHDVAISLYAVGNKHINAFMIYAVLNGYNHNKHFYAGTKDLILRSFDKLTKTFITVNGITAPLIPADIGE